MQLIRRIQIYTDTGAIGCPKNQNKDDLPLAILYGNAIRSCLDRKYLIQIYTYIYIIFKRFIYILSLLCPCLLTGGQLWYTDENPSLWNSLTKPTKPMKITTKRTMVDGVLGKTAHILPRKFWRNKHWWWVMTLALTPFQHNAKYTIDDNVRIENCISIRVHNARIIRGVIKCFISTSALLNHLGDSLLQIHALLEVKKSSPPMAGGDLVLSDLSLFQRIFL